MRSQTTPTPDDATTGRAQDAPARTGPLAGIRVLDLTAVVLGPVATQVLADYGAEVIKVEPPEGDLMRANGVSRTPGMSSTFMNINRNKSSVCVDLKTDSGKAALRQLIGNSDVLVHNIRVKAIERLGFGYDAVAQMNPGIIYCAATGFGEGGAFAGQPAFDDIIQGACGLAHLVGHETGVPDYPPHCSRTRLRAWPPPMPSWAPWCTRHAPVKASTSRYRCSRPWSLSR
ncbi:CoA transferase [Cupriavidus sp. EM10]|uniref:CoA transferase n=1 Tax=Cupriavidus sp. EM10 TaxID=2839983 RepID=UPI00351CEBCF